MASCCSSTLNLSWFFTLLTFSLSYFGLPFYCLSPFFLISTYFFVVYCPFLTTIYSLYFSTPFSEVHSIEMGSHTSYMQLSTFFLLRNIFSHKFHHSSVCSSSISLYKPISMPMFCYMSHTQTFFHGGSGSCDFLNFILIIYAWLNIKYFVTLLLINI